MFMLKLFAKRFSLNHRSVQAFFIIAMFLLFSLWMRCILSCNYLKIDFDIHKVNYPARLLEEDKRGKTGTDINNDFLCNISEETAKENKCEDEKCRAAFMICISNILQQCCYLVIIWFWIYAAKKYYREARKQKAYMEDILGKSDVTKKIWSTHRRLSHAWIVWRPLDDYNDDEEWDEDEDEIYIPIKIGQKVKCTEDSKNREREYEDRKKIFKRPEDSLLAIIVKLIYALAWILIMGLCDFFIIKLGYTPAFRNNNYLFDLPGSYFGINLLCKITIFLLVLTQFMSYHSWWLCIEYAYFLRNISKKIVSSDKYLNDIERDFKGNFFRNSPSETPSFRRLMHDSEMTSVAFLIVSSMFALSCLIPYGIMGTEMIQTVEYDITWMSVFVTCSAFLPGLVSLIPVSVLPKLFLYRILRKWKRISIKEIEAKIKLLEHKYMSGEFRSKKEIWKSERDRVYWEKQIYEISKNRFSLNVVGVMANVVTCVFYIYSIYVSMMSIMR